MKPIRLRIQNFKAHEDSEIQFKDGSLYYLVGLVDGNKRRSNNAGKSSVVHAINFALWKQDVEGSDVRLEELIRIGQDEAKVEFEFETVSGIVKVVRDIRRGKRGASSTVQVWVRQGDEFVEHDSREMSDRDAFLESCLGFSRYTWFRAAMRTQGVDPEFFAVTPDRRVEMLSKIMDHQDVMDRALEIVKSRLKDATQQKLELDAEIRAVRRTTLQDHEVSGLDHILKRNAEIVEQCRLDIKHIQQNDLVKQQIEKLEQDKQQYLFELNSTMEVANKDLLEQELKSQDLIRTLERARMEQRKEIDNNITNLDRELTRIQREVERYRQACAVEIMEPTADENQLSEQFDQVVKENKLILQDLAELDQQIAVLKSESKRLHAAKDSICPILQEPCDRISKDAVGQLIDVQQCEVTKRNNARSKLLISLTESDSQATALSEERQRAIKQRTDHAGYVASKHEYEQFLIRHRDDLDRIQQDLEASRLKRQALDSPAPEERAARQTLDEVQQALDNVELTDQARRWEDKANEAEQQIVALRKEVKSFVESVTSLERQIQQLEHEVSETRARLQAHQQAAQELGLIEKNLKPIDQRVAELENIKHTFGKKGFLAHHMQAIIPTLEHKVNEFLGFFDNGRLSVSMDEPLTVWDAVTETRFRPSSLSFGQRNVIAFCYGMALVWIKFSASPTIRMICLDEPFVHVDDDYLDSCMTVILHLYQELGLASCLLISHRHFDNHPNNLRVLEMRNQNGVCKVFET